MEAHTCTICDHFYNSSVKRPLVLPCSHSFCQDCVHQLELAGDKLCPVCRRNWGDVGAADLPCCYQLIPAKEKVPNDGIIGTTIEGLPEKICGEHKLALEFWCTSCKVPACKKCWRSDHRTCDVILLEEKCVAMRELYLSHLQPLKEEMQSKFKLYQANNKNDLEIVKNLQEKLLALEIDLWEYQKNLMSCQSEVDEVLANDMSLENDIQTIYDGISGLEKFQPQLPERPKSILLLIGNVHQNSGDDEQAFLSKLKCVLDVSDETSELSIPLAEAPPSCPSLAEAVESLEDGKVWTITDKQSAAAVMSVLHNTSTRPKSVEITCANSEELVQMDIESLNGANKQYDVGIRVEMDCFQNFEKPPAETIAATTARIAALETQHPWPTLTQFLGHLNADAVLNLPDNIKFLGLVLRDPDDMQALVAVGAIAFTERFSSNSCLLQLNQKKRLSKLTDLDLSVSNTFLSDNWETWKYGQKWGQKWQTLSNTLCEIHVRLHLHLPQLVPENRLWMEGLFSGIGLVGGCLETAVPLFLPGARIDPDVLLGVLRDTRQRWEVHLPTSLPHLVPREKLIERYTKYGHSVTWDLQ